MFAIPLRRGLAWLAAVALMAFGLVGLSATSAAALPAQCSGAETSGPDNITCPFLLPGQAINSLGGDDNIIAADAGGDVNSGAGNDTITAGALDTPADFDTGAGDDIVRVLGNHAGNSIFTGAGKDFVDVSGNNLGAVETGEDSDEFVVRGTANPAKMSLGSGDDLANIDTFNLAVDDNGLPGNSGDDTFTIRVCNASTIAGDAGNDTIDVTDANDCTVLGGAGNDDIHEGAQATGTVDGGPGTDTCQEDIPFLGTESNCEV